MECHHPKVQEMADAVTALCGCWLSHTNPHLLIVAGNSGCGKTLISRRALTFFSRSDKLAYDSGKWPGSKFPVTEFVHWPSLCIEIEEGVKESMAVRDVENADCVILDDIGAETDRYKSGFSTGLLARVLDGLKNKWGIITTNVHPSKWRERWDKRVEDRLLRHNSQIISMFDCPSFQEVQ